MAVRSLASLSVAFGLVSIPVKVYAATEASAALQFRLLGRQGTRLRQQFVVDEGIDDARWTTELSAPVTRAGAAREAPVERTARGRSADFGARAEASRRGAAGEARPAPGGVVERSDIVKGYEFEKGQFVLFTPGELKALAEGARPTIDIVSFIPERSVDPVYFDKPYYLAPDSGGARPYTLLLEAMRKTGRCALAKWAWRSRQHVAQIRPGDGGLVLQQLRYADEVRSLGDLGIELAEVGYAELELAIRLIEQISADAYDPHQFVDEEKLRIRAAIERKLAGREVVVPRGAERDGAQIVDLMQALRASLGAKANPKAARSSREALQGEAGPMTPRKPAQRAARRTAASAGAPRGAGSGR